MNSLQSPTLRLHGSNAPPHSWTRSPVQCRYENHVILCVIRHALHHAASRNDGPFQREGCHLRRRGERNRIRHHRLPAAALLAVWKVSHAMNPTKSAAPIPKIHRVALVDNDPRALESLSLLIEAKVPTAYVVWTATSGDEAIERCQRNDDNLNLLVLDMSMEGLQGPAICHRIRLMDRHLPILGITSFSINSYRSRLMEAGAQGLIGKEDSDQLAKAIERLCGGNVMEGFEPPALANVRIRREGDLTAAHRARGANHLPVRRRHAGQGDRRTTGHLRKHRAQAYAGHSQEAELQDGTPGSGIVGKIACTLNPQNPDP